MKAWNILLDCCSGFDMFAVDEKTLYATKGLKVQAGFKMEIGLERLRLEQENVCDNLWAIVIVWWERAPLLRCRYQG